MRKIGFYWLLMFSSPLWAEQVHEATLAESRWTVGEERLSCHLRHTIPGYGVVRFSRYAGKPLYFELAPTDRSREEKIRAVVLQFNPASWQHNEEPEMIAELDLHAGRKTITLQPALAETTLQALQNGKTPLFFYPSLQGGGRDQVIAAISPANFGSAYQKFLKCQDKLPGIAGAEARKLEVYFDKNSIDITESGMSTLLDVREVLKSDDRVRAVHLSCFTDNVGRPDVNKRLARQRCETVKDFLLEGGWPERKVTIKAYGVRFAVGDNRTAAGRARNRRAVIEFEYD